MSFFKKKHNKMTKKHLKAKTIKQLSIGFFLSFQNGFL